MLIPGIDYAPKTGNIEATKHSQVPLEHCLIPHDITHDTAITVAEGE